MAELSISAGDMKQAVTHQTGGSQNHTVMRICLGVILEREKNVCQIFIPCVDSSKLKCLIS